LLKEDGPGRYIRNHFKPNWVKKQLKTSPEEDTVVSREWKHKVANELVDRHPSNYPLYGVEKYVQLTSGIHGPLDFVNLSGLGPLLVR